MTSRAPTVTVEQFERLEVRAGTVVEARPFPEARKPLYRLRIDFGEEHGELDSAAGLTARYEPGELVGRQVLAVVNLPPRRIAGCVSQCLTLGVPDGEGGTVLVTPDAPVPDGARLF